MSVPEQVKFAVLEEEIRELRDELLDQRIKLNGIAKLVHRLSPYNIENSISDELAAFEDQFHEAFDIMCNRVASLLEGEV